MVYTDLNIGQTFRTKASKQNNIILIQIFSNFSLKLVAYQDTAALIYWTDTYGCPVDLYIESWSGLTFLPLAQFACRSVCSCLDLQRSPLIGRPRPDWPVYSCMPDWSSLPVYIYPHPFSFISPASCLAALIFQPVQLPSLQLLLAVLYFQVTLVNGAGGDFWNKNQSAVVEVWGFSKINFNLLFHFWFFFYNFVYTH